MQRTRIFIVHENQALVSQAAGLLNKEADLRVINMMSSATEALSRLSADNCDVILVSAALPEEGALKLIKRLRQQAGSAKVIVVGLSNNPQQILAYIAAGAAGYALAQEGVQRWVAHIQAVCKGKPMVSPAVTAAMMMHLNKLSRLTARFEPKSTLYANLTERECEILKFLAEGYSNQLIADHLIIGVGTVKNHVHNVLKKLNLRSRKDAATYLTFIQGKAPEVQPQYM
ncbi:MAG: response regulator transcription factor [Caldilineaceae bacterium]|nr:response regulator transcription factor [Caldilineaceae bacterium]